MIVFCLAHSVSDIPSPSSSLSGSGAPPSSNHLKNTRSRSRFEMISTQCWATGWLASPETSAAAASKEHKQHSGWVSEQLQHNNRCCTMCWCGHLTVTNHWQVATALVCHGGQSAVCVDEGHRSNSVGVSATEHGVVAAEQGRKTCRQGAHV